MNKHSGISTIAKDGIVVAIAVGVILISVVVVLGPQNPLYVVSSGSMVPNLNIDDVLVVKSNYPFKDIVKGDIIVFNRPTGHDRVIVHRIAEIIDENPRVVRTKGDANPASIPGTDYPITDKEYIGKVVYVISNIGFIPRIIAPPVNYIIIAVIVAIMIYNHSRKKKTEPISSADQTLLQNSDVKITEENVNNELNPKVEENVEPDKQKEKLD